MRVLEKLLLFVLVLLVLAAGVGGMAMCFLPLHQVEHWVGWGLASAFASRWLVLICSGVLILLAVLLFFGVVCRGGGKKSETKAANVVKVGGEGSNVQISTQAVDCIIQQQKLQFPDVISLESKISGAAEGTEIILKVTAKANANMQELAANLQTAVKQQLESMVGLKVNAVKVIIADVVGEAEPEA